MFNKYIKLPSYASRLHTWIVFNIPLAIDTLRLRICVVSYPYTMFWTGLQLIILHLYQHCFLFNTRETHWKFYRKRDNTIPDFFLLQYTFFTYFVSPIFSFVFISFSIVFFLGRVCIRYILVKVNDTQNCFSNKNKSLYNERFRNDVVW